MSNFGNVQLDQIVTDVDYPSLGSEARESLTDVLLKLSKELESPLRLHATFPTENARLNFALAPMDLADGAKKSLSPVKKQIFSFLSGAWINFQDQTVSNAAHFDIAFPASTVGLFRYVGFTLIGSGKIKAIFSAEAASEGALSDPGALFVSGGLPLGYVALECTNVLGYFKTAGSATDIIENAKIYRLASGGGGSSASSGSGAGGGELTDLLFQAAIRDSFADIPDGNTTVDINSGRTDAALHDVANELFRLSYDASKTVSATGTAATISGAPSFTIKAGDMIVINSTGEARRIASISSQTSVTLELAFSVDPSAEAACVSQAVHTVDLNAFDAGGTGLSAASQYTGDIDEILVGYEDSDTLSDLIPDFGTVADIAYSASADDTSWSTARIRTNSLSDESSAISTPTANNELYLRFFANKTSGTGAVNLLSYKVFFHRQTGETVGQQLLSAFARPTDAIYQNCTHNTVSGKSRFSFDWAFPRGVNSGEASGSALVVYANGQRVPRYEAGVTDDTQAYFKELSDTLIEMDVDYSAADIDFQFRVERTIIDSNTLNVTRISEIEDVLTQDIETQVVPTWLTAVNGSPSATQFRSDITNRSRILDFAANLYPSFGVNRIMTPLAVRMQDEFGPSGEEVFFCPDDKFNMIRFVGVWANFMATSGPSVQTSTLGSYVEIVFYGTDLNIVTGRANNTGDWRASIDGGAEGSDFSPASWSSALNGRNYAPLNILRVASNLTLGKHTVKIRNASADFLEVAGIEVINKASTTSVGIEPGVAIKGKNELILPSRILSAYNSGFESGTLGTRGGNVVAYLKEDGTIGKAVTPVNSSAAYHSSADHSNEEIIRRYHFREFGASRADDFSTQAAASTDRAFTLDDNMATLVSDDVELATFSGVTGLHPTTDTDYMVLTFTGCGVDLFIGSGTIGIQIAFYIDGVYLGAPSIVANVARTYKVASGLPYGSHTLRIAKTSITTCQIAVADFIIYGPKKPSIPDTAIELAQYNILADYAVAGTPQNTEVVPTGVIKKTNMREAVYVGTWSGPTASLLFNGDVGFNTLTATTGSYFEHTFYGTGFEWRTHFTNTQVFNITISVNGVTNLSGAGYTTAIHSASPMTFTATTGVITGTGGGHNGQVRVTGMPLDVYTIRITQNNSVSNMYHALFHFITPIYMPSFNLPVSLQSALDNGNQGLLDSRKFNFKDLPSVERLKSLEAVSNGTNPTTSSTSPVLMPDMMVSYYSEGESVEVQAMALLRNDTANNWTGFAVYMNGVEIIPIMSGQSALANSQVAPYSSKTFYLPKGFYLFEMRWRVSAGTGTELSSRKLMVKKSGE